jgi:hypothetical protein
MLSTCVTLSNQSCKRELKESFEQLITIEPQNSSDKLI